MSQEQISALIAAGMIRESYLTLGSNFAAEYELQTAKPVTVKSYRGGGDVEMPRFIIKNEESYHTIWASTLLNALVVKDLKAECKPIAKANGLPVFFRDEFTPAYPSARALSTYRSDDGGFEFEERYQIIGAIVYRSKVDVSRWSIASRMYDRGALFLEYERLHHNNPKLGNVSEERIYELSKLDKKGRTYKGANGDVTLPSFAELKISAGADTDVQFASAQFIVKDTWTK